MTVHYNSDDDTSFQKHLHAERHAPIIEMIAFDELNKLRHYISWVRRGKSNLDRAKRALEIVAYDPQTIFSRKHLAAMLNAYKNESAKVKDHNLTRRERRIREAMRQCEVSILAHLSLIEAAYGTIQ